MTVKQTNKRSTAARASKPAAPAPEQEKELKAAADAPVAEQAPAQPESAPAPAKEPEPAPQADSEPGQGAKEAEAKDQGKEPATDGLVQDGAAQDDTGAASGGVSLEVVTRLPRRIRAGVTVTRAPTRVEVGEDVAAQLEADRHIKVKRL